MIFSSFDGVLLHNERICHFVPVKLAVGAVDPLAMGVGSALVERGKLHGLDAVGRS